MNVGNRWLLVFALVAAAAAGAMVASGRRRDRAIRRSEHREDLKAWENEGGNLAPAATATRLP